MLLVSLFGVHNKVIQIDKDIYLNYIYVCVYIFIYMCIYIIFFRFFSTIGYYKIWNIVPLCDK